MKTQDKRGIRFLRYLHFMVHFGFFIFIMYKSMSKPYTFIVVACAWMARAKQSELPWYCKCLIRISAKTSIYLNILGFALVWKLACRLWEHDKFWHQLGMSRGFQVVCQCTAEGGVAPFFLRQILVSLPAFRKIGNPNAKVD